jgi:uncharacterized protein YdhG (YjbR/CyaY superfamily)
VARLGSSSVDAYLANHPPETRAALQCVRTILRRALPGAEETISYGIPAYRQHGSVVVYFAGWKEHYSLYPVTARLTAALASELAPYLIGRATARFPLSAPVPARLIGRIAKRLAHEAAERARAKGRGRKKRAQRSRAKARRPARSTTGAHPDRRR